MSHDYDDPAHDADMAELRREQLAADVGDDADENFEEEDFDADENFEEEDFDADENFEEEDFDAEDYFEEEDFVEENEWPVNRSYDRV